MGWFWLKLGDFYATRVPYIEGLFLFELKKVIAFAFIWITKRAVLFWENTYKPDWVRRLCLSVVIMVVAQIVKVNKGGGCLTKIWQVISIAKNKEEF